MLLDSGSQQYAGGVPFFFFFAAPAKINILDFRLQEIAIPGPTTLRIYAHLIGSPAAMFDHTLRRWDKKHKSQDTGSREIRLFMVTTN